MSLQILSLLIQKSIFWQKIISYGMYMVSQHTHLSVWCLHPPKQLVTNREITTECNKTQSAWLNRLVLKNQFNQYNGRSECAWFSQCVILSADDLPFSSSLPNAALLKLPGEEKNTASIVSSMHPNTRGLHHHANSHGPDLQVDFYLLHPSGSFYQFSWTIWCLFGVELVIHPVFDHHGKEGNSLFFDI